MPRQKRQQRAAASGLRLALPALVGAAATLIVGMAAVPTADAKSPGTRYCFHGYCHRVGTLAQTDTVSAGGDTCSLLTTTAAISTD